MKENKITIKANSGLSEEEIKKMEEDAAKHAEEDKKLKELVDAKNSAEALIHGTNKSLKDHADKLEGDDKEKIEAAIKNLEEAISSDDKTKIEDKSKSLAEAAQKFSEKIYAAQQGSPNAGSSANSSGENSEKTVDGDVVDAEFEEVKEDEKKEEDK